MTATGASTEQLLRLLRIIPLASRPEGLRIADAARLCEVTEAVIDADIRVLADRSWYLPPGSTDDFQILLEGDRVHLLAPPAFRRPVRLGLHERLALSLALRCAGMDDAEARALGRTLEAACALEAARSETHGGAPPTRRDNAPPAEAMAFFLPRPDTDAIHDQVAQALVNRERIEVHYLKEGATAPEPRHLEPWSLLHAEGEGYLLAHDLDRAGPRLFRVDRMLGVRITGEPSTAPIELGPAQVSAGGAVRLVADGRPLETARVRYSPRVARWIRERHPGGEELEDGGYLVEHPIFTDAWIVRRVLQVGPEAEILAPARLRAAVVEAVNSRTPVDPNGERTRRPALTPEGVRDPRA